MSNQFRFNTTKNLKKLNIETSKLETPENEANVA